MFSSFEILFFMKYLHLHFQLDSLEKLDKLLEECQKLGVHTDPLALDDLGVIPLFSWYHEVNSEPIYTIKRNFANFFV